MKFEFTGDNTQSCKLLLDGNPITYCQSVDFHVDVNTMIPIVRMELIPVEGMGIIFSEVEGYITIGTKTYKLTEVVPTEEATIIIDEKDVRNG